MAYYLLVRYYSNKGYILDNPHYYSSGVTSYSSVTASSSSSYKYFKTDSTRTNQTSTVIKGATTSSGTYGNVGNRYTASSASTVCDLVDVSTFGLTRDGYHINASEAYKSSDGSKVYGQNGSSAPSANRATISRLGGSTSANKTVSIYVNWIGNSYSVKFNPSGGSGTMSDQTGFVFGTGKALSSNTFTRTGYMFAGWSKSPIGDQTVDYANQASMSDAGGQIPVEAGTTVVNLYAVWTPNTYTVLFNDNQADGSGTGFTEKTVTYNSNDNRITPVTKPTRHGYYFEGYYDARTGGNQVYDSSVIGVSGTYWSSNNTWQYTNNVNLYAHWSPLSSMYKLNPNGGTYGGTTGITNKTVTFGSTNNNTPGVPTRTGFQFTGWYTEVEGGRQVFDSNGNPVEDYLNGPWVSCSPTISLGTNARYLHYGEVVWGWYYNSRSDNKLAFWAEGQWNVKSINSSYGDSYLYGAGNLIGSLQPQIQVSGLVALTAAHCDTEQSQIITNTGVFGTNFSFNNNIVASSTTLPTDGYVWIATYSSTPTYYAHWIETTPPSNLSITSTNNVASSQTVTLSATDNIGITGYYWGTSSSTSVTYTSVTSTTSWSTTKTVSSGFRYYLRVKDAAGNTNYTTKRFYKTSFEAANGSVSPSSVITMEGNSFALPTPIPNSGYDVTNGYWVIIDVNYYLYGTTYTPTSNLTLVTGCAKSGAGRLPAVGVVITDDNNNFSMTTNNNGEASIGVNTLNNIWEDYGGTTAIFIGGSNAIKPSYCAETVMWKGGSTGYHMVDHGDYSVKVTIIDGYYHFYVYDLNSTAPKIYVKNNGTWKPAIAYVKINGAWKLMPTAYVKQNGSWTQTT